MSFQSARRLGLLLACLALLFALPACSSRVRKLSSGGAMDVLLYDILGQSRNPDYYYSLLRDSHDPESDKYEYRPADDKFLVDKNVDAAEKLGAAQFARLEGQAMTVVILSHMLLEDPAAMARTNAASSLTKIGLRLPRYPEPAYQPPIERGTQLLAAIRELDAMHNERALRHPSYAQRRLQLVQEIGQYHILDLEIARDSLKLFFTRDYLIDATDSQLRAAADTALVRRTDRMVRLALRAGLDSPVAHTRRQAVIGLKILSDRGAESTVLARLQIESDWQVRSEAIEYLGKLASVDGLAVLIAMLDAPDPSIRHKSRQALVRIAGRDYGKRRAVWTQWARQRFPDRFREQPERDEEDENDQARPGGAAPTPPAPDDEAPLPPAPDDGPLPPAPEDDTPLPPAPIDEPLPPAPIDNPSQPQPLAGG